MKVSQITKDVIVKVTFKDHDPRFTMIGKFIDFRDAAELEKKNMVRFVNQSRIEFYNAEEPSINLSRIYKADDFRLIQPV